MKLILLEYKVNSVELDHVDQYSYPKKNIFVVKQRLIVHQSLVDEEFLNDQAIKLKEIYKNKRKKFKIERTIIIGMTFLF